MTADIQPVDTVLKATWSVRGFLFLLQNHVIWYKLYLLWRTGHRYRPSKDVFMYHLGVENRRSNGAYFVYTSNTLILMTTDP